MNHFCFHNYEHIMCKHCVKEAEKEYFAQYQKALDKIWEPMLDEMLRIANEAQR